MRYHLPRYQDTPIQRYLVFSRAKHQKLEAQPRADEASLGTRMLAIRELGKVPCGLFPLPPAPSKQALICLTGWDDGKRAPRAALPWQG